MLATLLSILISFSTAQAACPKFFGTKAADGTWSFYEGVQPAGTSEVEADPDTCKVIHQALKWDTASSKYKLDRVIAETTKAGEKAERDARQVANELSSNRKATLRNYLSKGAALTALEQREVLFLLLQEGVKD